MPGQPNRRPRALLPAAAARVLDAERFQQLAVIPPEQEWYSSLGPPATRRAYRHALEDFMRFAGLTQPPALRRVTRAHVLAWRHDLASRVPALSGATIRHRLAALSSLFDYLCERNAVTHNPVRGVKRPAVESLEGKTATLGKDQARRLLEAPDKRTLKGLRDRAMLAILLFHGLRREELCRLKVKDCQQWRGGMAQLRISGKGGKVRDVALHPQAQRLVAAYLKAAGHANDGHGALFRPLHPAGRGQAAKAISADGVYKLVRGYAAGLGFAVGAHALRATAATNALEHQADMAAVQAWLGHASIATTRLYDRRQVHGQGSPTFRIAYA